MFNIKDFQFVMVLDLIVAASYYCGSLSFSAKLFWGFGSVSSMFFVHVKKKNNKNPVYVARKFGDSCLGETQEENGSYWNSSDASLKSLRSPLEQK